MAVLLYSWRWSQWGCREWTVNKCWICEQWVLGKLSFCGACIYIVLYILALYIWFWLRSNRHIFCGIFHYCCIPWLSLTCVIDPIDLTQEDNALQKALALSLQEMQHTGTQISLEDQDLSRWTTESESYILPFTLPWNNNYYVNLKLPKNLSIIRLTLPLSSPLP